MKNYLVYDITGEESAMEVNMLLHCRPSWLPAPELRVVDGEYRLYYMVSGMKPFTVYCSGKKLGLSELKLLISGLVQVIDDTEEYLLSPDDVVLNPNYMFTAPGPERLRFLYFPGYNISQAEQVLIYVEKLLSLTDTTDTEAAAYIYNLHNDICTEGPGIELLARYAKGDYEDKLGIGSYNMRGLPPAENYLMVADPDSDSLYCNESRISSVLRGAKDIFRPRHQKKLPVYESIRLSCLDGSLPDIYPGKNCVVGRSLDTSDYAIDRHEISRMHTRFYMKGDELYMEDLNSRNGTFINDIKLPAGKSVKLDEGDDVCIGGVWFRVSLS